MLDPEDTKPVATAALRLTDTGRRTVGLALAAAGLAAGAATWARRARARARERAELERLARWEAEAPERQSRRLESEKRERQRHEEFIAAADAKGWRYEAEGQCCLYKGKKRFPTELDAQICTWKQREQHGGQLQRVYLCDGRDAPDGNGCGSWHLTSKPFFN